MHAAVQKKNFKRINFFSIFFSFQVICSHLSKKRNSPATSGILQTVTGIFPLAVSGFIFSVRCRHFFYLIYKFVCDFSLSVSSDNCFPPLLLAIGNPTVGNLIFQYRTIIHVGLKHNN